MQVELQQLLRELIEVSGAESSAIAAAGPGRPPCAIDVDGGQLRRASLGSGAVLELRFIDTGDDDHRAAALERSVRALRACLRRWNADEFPLLRATREQADSTVARDRVVARIETYLRAFAASQGVGNAVVTVRGDVVASADELEPYQRARLPFLLKQVSAEVASHRGQTSHVEVLRDDVCAFSFWFDACLIAFCDGNHSVDFLRHRAKMVARELSLILPHLDEPPPEPVNSAPIPE